MSADFWAKAAALLNGAAGVGVALGELRHEHVDGPRVGRERAVCFDFDLELIRNRRRVESVAKSWRNFYEEDDVEAACRWVIEAREWLAEMATLPRPGPPARELSGCFEYVPRRRDQVRRLSVEIRRAIRNASPSTVKIVTG